MFVVSVFPYIAVETYPTNSGWGSRNELLLPLFASLMTYGIIKIFGFVFGRWPKYYWIIMAIVVASFTNININNYVRFQTDWYYQKSIIENMKNNDKLEKANTLLL